MSDDAVNDIVPFASFNSLDYNDFNPQYGGFIQTGHTQTFKTCYSHTMAEESEIEDGRVVSHCITCGDKIVGRRMAGGLGLPRLKSVLIDAVGDPGFVPDLVDELDRVEMMLELEEHTLEEARNLIKIARKMLAASLGANKTVE